MGSGADLASLRERAASRSSAGRARYGIPVARLARVAKNSVRRDAQLFASCAGHRLAKSGASRGECMRSKSRGPCNSLPPGGAGKRGTRRLPLGRGTQTDVVSAGESDQGVEKAAGLPQTTRLPCATNYSPDPRRPNAILPGTERKHIVAQGHA